MSQDWKPGTQVGRWRVVECLGEGGQGAVYRVEDTEHPGDFYALKRSFLPWDKRAEREVVLLMSRAMHPHVVRFHACARWPHPREGALGFIMDWVPGQALDVWAETEGTTFRQLATVGATVAHTLGELHARGVLHRDLKPEHIVISEEDGEPVLLDFGAGWYEGAAPITTGPLPPATRYLLSPEAVRFLWDSPQHPGAHHAFQPGEDLYALGVTKPDWEAPSAAFVPRERGQRWSRGLLLALAVLLLLLPLTRERPAAPGVERSDEEQATDGRIDPSSAGSERAPLPVANQKRAPCTEELEVEVSGACWLRLWQQPPHCPRQTIVYRGQCLLPVLNSRPVPTSVDGGLPESR